MGRGSVRGRRQIDTEHFRTPRPQSSLGSTGKQGLIIIKPLFSSNINLILDKNYYVGHFLILNKVYNWINLIIEFKTEYQSIVLFVFIRNFWTTCYVIVKLFSNYILYILVFIPV